MICLENIYAANTYLHSSYLLSTLDTYISYLWTVHRIWKRILNYYFVWFGDIVYQNNLFVLKKLEKLLHENQNRKSLSDPVNNLLWYVFENGNHDIKQNNKTYNLLTDSIVPLTSETSWFIDLFWSIPLKDESYCPF